MVGRLPSLEILPGREVGGAMKPSGKLWPNGEFTLGYSEAGGRELELTPAEYAELLGCTPLGLSIPPNSHKERDEGAPKRGSGGLTSDGMRMVRCGVELMERKYGRKNLSFLTLTLPEVTFEEGWNVSSNWSEICRIFYQKLGRRMEAKLLPKTWVGVTELQERREKREGHPCLHLHIILVGRQRGQRGWAFSPGEFREMWASVCGSYLFQEKEWSACENVQMVRYSAGGYLSKYMSKGVGGVPPRGDETGWSLPTAWYNMPSRMRRYIRENVRKDRDLMELLETFVKLPNAESCCHYLYYGELSLSSGTTIQYVVGKVRREFMREILDIWRESKGLGVDSGQKSCTII